MKYIRAAILSLLFAIHFTALAEDTNFFPVMAWNHVPNDPAIIKKMRECGLTVAGFAAPDALDAIHAAGMKAIVSDARVGGYDWLNVDEKVARTNVTSLIAQVGKHPAVYGYYLRDEPPSSFFPGLAKVASVIHELAPDKWAYINLFPNYADLGQLGATSYADYIDKFVAACKPTQLSYDHYALMFGGSLREGYFLNLEQMRNAAIKNKLPFWNIILTTAHFNYREVSAADVRFQVFTTLAYGGRGISYFTYFAPQIGNFRMAPIDQFGNPTVTWDHVQNVNLQIARLAPTLLQLTSDDVYHFGDALPEGCHKATDKSLVKDIRGDFLVGDFTHKDGTRYVMLVNKNVKKSIPCQPQFRIAPKSLAMVSPYSGQLTSFDGEQIWLAPGQAVLLKPSY